MFHLPVTWTHQDAAFSGVDAWMSGLVLTVAITICGVSITLHRPLYHQ